MTILSKIENKPIQEPLSNFTKQEIAQANQRPLEFYYTGALKTKNRKYSIGLCPFHAEKTPSFVIYNETNTAHCFGACAKSWDTIGFVMQKDNLSFLEVVRKLL